jgi:hypothetical protein
MLPRAGIFLSGDVGIARHPYKNPLVLRTEKIAGDK